MQKIIINSFIVIALVSGSRAYAHDPVVEKKEQKDEVIVQKLSPFESAQSYVAHTWATMVDNAKKIPLSESRKFMYAKAHSLLNNVYVAGLWALGTAGISTAMRYSKTARSLGRNYAANLRNGDRKTLAYTGGGIAALLALYYRHEIAASFAKLAGYNKSIESNRIDRSQLDQIESLQRQLQDAQNNQRRLEQELQDAQNEIDNNHAHYKKRLSDQLKRADSDYCAVEEELRRNHEKLLDAQDEISALTEQLDREKRKKVLLEAELDDLSRSSFRPFSEAKENLQPFNLRTLTIIQLREIQAEIEAQDQECGPLEHVNLTLSFDRDGYTGHELEVQAPHQDLNETIDE